MYFSMPFIVQDAGTRPPSSRGDCGCQAPIPELPLLSLRPRRCSPYLALGVQASSEEVPRWAGLLQQPLQQPQAQPPIAAGQQDTAHAEPLHPHCSPQPVVLPQRGLAIGLDHPGGGNAAGAAGMGGGRGHRLHPPFWRRWGSRVFCMPGSPITLTIGLLHSSTPQNTHPPQAMGIPKG